MSHQNSPIFPSALVVITPHFIAIVVLLTRTAPPLKLAFFFCLLLFPSPALTEELETAECDTNCNETTLTLGGGLGFAPKFEGSSDYEVTPLPLIAVENFYGLNLGPGGASYRLFSWEDKKNDWQLTLGPMVGMSDTRDEGDSDSLRGLGDVDFGIDVGAFANFSYGPVNLDLVVNQEVADGHGGFVATFGVGTSFPVTERLFFSPTVSTTWADDNYMSSFFGVTSAQAAKSQYSKFDAGAGFKNVALELQALYRVTDNIALTAGVSYSRLLGDAANSPLVTGAGGSADQFSTMLGLGYRF